MEISNPVSVELHIQDNVAYSSTCMPWRQRQATQPQEHKEDLSSETNREIGPESLALELKQNVAYSTVAMTRGQGKATQQQEPQESNMSRRNHEVSPESLQINIAYSSTFWRQGEDILLQETEEEYLYATID